jgi:ankyrin repeat protein
MSSGNRELFQACETGSLDTVTSLLEAGVDVNEVYKTGNSFLDDDVTYLMVAAMWGHTDVVKKLLDYNADLEARDHNGYTALMLCFYDNDQFDPAKVLLTRGCAWDATNHSETALDYLSEEDRQMMDDFIIDLDVERELAIAEESDYDSDY